MSSNNGWAVARRAGLVVVLAVVVPLVAVLGSVALLNGWGIRFSPLATTALVVVLSVAYVVAVLRAFGSSGGGGRSRSYPDQALGLPDGSVRAILAIGALVAFVGVSVYVVNFVGLVADQKRDVVQQVVTTLGTLVAAVAAFYFGANSVQSGVSAVKALATPVVGPEAMTKGNAQAKNAAGKDVTELVGFVNPHGLPTRAFFDVTRTSSDDPPTTFNERSDETIVPAGEGAVQVRIALPDPQLPTGAWYRLVAFNDNGGSTGGVQKVGGP